MPSEDVAICVVVVVSALAAIVRVRDAVASPAVKPPTNCRRVRFCVSMFIAYVKDKCQRMAVAFPAFSSLKKSKYPATCAPKADLDVRLAAKNYIICG